jgi:hypothetical protein
MAWSVRCCGSREQRFSKFAAHDSSNPDACWLWQGTKARGYGALTIKGEKVLAHRLAWEIHRGPIPPGQWVLHRCDVRACVNPAHLFLGTCADNVHDMVRKGRGSKPPKKPAVAPDVIARIREGRALGLSLPALVRTTGVSMGSVFKIVSRRSPYEGDARAEG